MAWLFTAGKSRRQQQNALYAFKTMQVIKKDVDGFSADSTYAWLICDEPKIQKISILAELGRLDDPEDVLECARSICEQKLSVKMAVALIRKGRGKQRAGNLQDKLYMALACCLRDFLAVHPDLTDEDIIRVLNVLTFKWETVT